MAARGRYFIFTENVNPDQLRNALIEEGLPPGISYVCAQLEEGTHLHYQGYIELEVRQRITWLKSNFSTTAHFEIRRGTQEEAIHYTKKPVAGCDCKNCTEERTNPTAIQLTWNEFGEPFDDKKGKRNDLEDVRAMIIDGCSEEEIADEHFGSWLRYGRYFREYRQLKAPKRDPAVGVEVIVYYGGTGLGKSRMAYELYSDAYRKPVSNQWFDGFAGEETVVFDEFNGSWMPFGMLLTISDRYPCTVPCKGGHIRFNAKRLVFTTNRHPKHWYREDYSAALLRRITTLLYFEKDQDPRISVHPFDDIPEYCPGDVQQRPPQNLIPNYPWN